MNGRALSERGISRMTRRERCHGAGDHVHIKHCLNVKTLKRDNEARMSVSPILTFFPNLLIRYSPAGSVLFTVTALGSHSMITLSYSLTTLPEFIRLWYYNWPGNSKNATEAFELSTLFLCMTNVERNVLNLKRLLHTKYLI